MIERPTPEHVWIWQAHCLRVVDGDTLELEFDVGFRAYRRELVRLYGVDTPETIGKTSAAGKQSKLFVEDWLSEPSAHIWPLLVVTAKPERDKYGRWLALVWAKANGQCLNDELVKGGFAIERFS